MPAGMLATVHFNLQCLLMVVCSGVQEDLGSQLQGDTVVAKGSLFFDHGEEIQVSLPCVTNMLVQRGTGLHLQP